MIRVNCVDCLDRTNVGQYVIGHVVMAHQLCLLGRLPETALTFSSALSFTNPMAQLMSTGWAEGDDASGRRPRPCSMGPITSATSNGKPNSLASKVAHTINRIEGMKRRDARLRRNDDGEHFDARFKVVLLGDSGVGKTSLIRSAMGEDFNPSMISTIG
ncbi:unnamed protein product [Schistocephalus solidus]|uniref:SAC domain-containing protein n=1 Tax=Schistocephalus solidus TaxID=70667 RepID=A0A183TQX6_SCHSO|nr:unnamed protein product [Schistocephalus solidus]